MRCTIVFAVAISVAMPAPAQDQPNNLHQATTLPTGARFEILQSELAARWTFRLDRFTGRVAQLARTKDDDNTWEEMEVIERPAMSAPTRARFQLFSSGLAAKYTLLIDTDTGQTWQIVTVKRKTTDGSQQEVIVWQPFPR